MLWAILSDIHANREALDAVLAHVRRKRWDQALVLGDVAVVDNEALTSTSMGGGIYFADGAGGIIDSSVITANHSGGYTGGIYLFQPGTGPNTATVTVSIPPRPPSRRRSRP